MVMKQGFSRGAVSLFIVVFSAMLLSVVTISFLRLMIQDQTQASDNDLSQSAYDSAQAGVQDAERAILRYQNYCPANAGQAECSPETLAKWATVCNQSLVGIYDSSIVGREQPVQTGSSNFNQAYTCVKVALDTPDFIGVASEGDATIVPLRADANFDNIRVNWWNSSDIGNSGVSQTVSLPDFNVSDSNPLPSSSNWDNTSDPNNKSYRPSLLRTQLIEASASGYSVNDLASVNNNNSKGGNWAMFNYPTCGQPCSPTDSYSPNITGFATADSPQVNKNGQSVDAKCINSLSAGGYACGQIIYLPSAATVDVNGNQSVVAYLVIKPLYHATHFQVQLFSGSTPVNFKAVQPEIDSTGRAADLFRRVAVRVNLFDSNFPFPSNAVDVTGSFCKNYVVSSSTNEFKSINTVSGSTINNCKR